MIEYAIRCLADGDLPQVFPGVHVDRGDPAVWRLEERQAVRSSNLVGAKRRPFG